LIDYLKKSLAAQKGRFRYLFAYANRDVRHIVYYYCMLNILFVKYVENWSFV